MKNSFVTFEISEKILFYKFWKFLGMNNAEHFFHTFSERFQDFSSK